MRIVSILMLIWVAGCQATTSDNTTTDNSLYGEWRNLTLKVELDKKHGEPTSIFEVNESTWESELQIRPFQTFFNKDRTFNSAHYNLQDSLVLNPHGTWTATTEKVLMITTAPFSDSTACIYSIKDDIVTFGCWVDWDEDGEKDDWYLGTQKKYKTESN